MNNDLQKLQDLVNELNLNNSNNYKKEVLIKYPECKELLKLTYSPFVQFNISSEVIKKNIKTNLQFEQTYFGNIYELTIYDFLDLLSTRTITGNEAIYISQQYIGHNQAYKELIYKIIDKNLETRTSIATINAVFPNLIKEFNVALASKYEDRKDKIDFENELWFRSRKLDGCRCIAIKKNDKIDFFSRNGKPFYTLDNLKPSLLSVCSEDGVFDGEICIVDENGNENYSSIMKEIRRKEHTIKNPKYIIFDFLTIEEFQTGKSETYFKERIYSRLNKINENIFFNPEITNIEVLRQIPTTSKKILDKKLEEAIEAGWEGLILRKDAPYEGKRSNNLLKVKKFQDAEYRVIDLEMGINRIIDESTKLEKEEMMLANVFIKHKGNLVRVGSGFSLAERKRFYVHPEEIMGKTITITYFEETLNQDGKNSLRFPIFKYLHGDKRET